MWFPEETGFHWLQGSCTEGFRMATRLVYIPETDPDQPQLVHEHEVDFQWIPGRHHAAKANVAKLHPRPPTGNWRPCWRYPRYRRIPSGSRICPSNLAVKDAGPIWCRWWPPSTAARFLRAGVPSTIFYRRTEAEIARRQEVDPIGKPGRVSFPGPGVGPEVRHDVLRLVVRPRDPSPTETALRYRPVQGIHRYRMPVRGKIPSAMPGPAPCMSLWRPSKSSTRWSRTRISSSISWSGILSTGHSSRWFFERPRRKVHWWPRGFDLPHRRRRRGGHPPGVHPVRVPGRTDAVQVALDDLGPCSRGRMGRPGRIHRRTLPVDATGKPSAAGGERGRLQRGVHRPLYRADRLPSRLDPRGPGGTGGPDPGDQLGHILQVPDGKKKAGEPKG